EHHDREVVLEQLAQRLLTRRRAHHLLAQWLENGLERQQVLGAIVDDQDLHLIAHREHRAGSRLHGGRHAVFGACRCTDGRVPRKSAIRSRGNTRAVGTQRSAANGMTFTSAVAGSWTTAIPPLSAMRRRPSAPSAFAPVSTTPTARWP